MVFTYYNSALGWVHSVDENSTSNEQFAGSNSDEMYLFGLGNDTIVCRGGADNVSAGGGNDLVYGDSGRDILHGGDGNDRLYGGSGDDVLDGDSGDDTIAIETGYANFGRDNIDGGEGIDTVVFETGYYISVNGNPSQFSSDPAAQGIFISLADQFDFEVHDFSASLDADGNAPQVALIAKRGTVTLSDVEKYVLTSYSDYFIGGSGNRSIYGGAGNDFIDGAGGSDLIDGGSGTDTVMYTSSASGVSIALLDLGSGGSGSSGDANGDILISIENAIGTGYNDSLMGSGGNNDLRGMLGDDLLLGLNGNDSIYGHLGHDELNGGNGDDRLIGSYGNDKLIGGSGNDSMAGGYDNDEFFAGSGNDTLDGGIGTDTADFAHWNDVNLSGVKAKIALGNGTTAGEATLTQSVVDPSGLMRSIIVERDLLTSIENAYGSNLGESVTGNGVGNVLSGRGGNDVIDGGFGNDSMYGGDGIDTLSFASFAAVGTTTVSASLSTGTATSIRPLPGSTTGQLVQDTDTFYSFENITGSEGNDILTGNAQANLLSGGNGSDVLMGLAGNDTLHGGNGSDTADYRYSASGMIVDLAAGQAFGLNGERDTLIAIENIEGTDGADELTGNAAANRINGYGGIDEIRGGAGADTLDGGEGIDSLIYADSAAVSIALDGSLTQTGDAAGDVVFNFEFLIGSLTGNDTLGGDGGANLIMGLGGNDTLDGGFGSDTLDGGTGFDTASYYRFFQAADIDLQSGTLGGVVAGDTLISIEAIIGSGIGNDTMRGDAGGNWFAGSGGQDLLQGREGNDVLDGGSNADTINGGQGNDTLTGGSEADIFVFAGQNIGQDVITDFEDGIDLIRFNTSLADSFGDLAISGNGTNQVTVIYGGQMITVNGTAPITLSNADFDF